MLPLKYSISMLDKLHLRIIMWNRMPHMFGIQNTQQRNRRNLYLQNGKILYL